MIASTLSTKHSFRAQAVLAQKTFLNWFSPIIKERVPQRAAYIQIFLEKDVT